MSAGGARCCVASSGERGKLGVDLSQDLIVSHLGHAVAQPVGYWNALAIFSAMGVILAAGFAARARPPVLRALCAALLVFYLGWHLFG